MSIVIGKSYWHNHYNFKVWVDSIDRPALYIVKDVKGYFYIACEHELEEV